jgi:hypothetical protein
LDNHQEEKNIKTQHVVPDLEAIQLDCSKDSEIVKLKEKLKESEI